MKRQRPKPGDVLSLTMSEGIAYLRYLGKHEMYGDAVMVSRRFAQAQAPINLEVFAGGYVVFYPVIAAAGQGLVEVVAQLRSPGLPSRMRRPGVREGRAIKSWIIEKGDGRQTVKSKLSDSELQLPLAVIWNHEFLVTRINEGWHPSQEGGST